MEPSQFARAVETVLQQLPGAYETTATPVLILVTGLPGTGKSFLTHKIVERLPAVIVESDQVRKILFPHPTYAGEESVWVHRVAHAAIERLLKASYRVIYDATNLVEWHREKVYWMAHRTGAKLVIVQTVAPEEVIRTRLENRLRQREADDLSDANWAIYLQLRKRVDAITRPHLVVDTQGDMDKAIRKIVRAAA
jgi:predicted kinase